jgi:hypothetical protein
MAKKLELGDKFVFHKCKANKDLPFSDATVGKIYTVAGKDVDGFYFIDNEGDRNYCGIGGDNDFKITKIKE